MLQIDSRPKEILVVLAIVVVAAIFRLYNLDQLPPGLHYDEAFKGVMARKLIVGPDRPIFFTENLTEEPMMEYATALSFLIFGDTAWHIRLVSAIAGIITVIALYFLARQLFAQRWVAWLATFVLAILYWHLNFSRLGMEPILTPMTLTLAFVFLWQGIYPHPSPPPSANPSTPLRSAQDADGRGSQTPSPVRQKTSNRGGLGWGRWGALTLAGFFLASTQYTYKAALFVPFLIIAFFGLEIVVERGFFRQNWRRLIFCALVAVLFFAPLGLYFVAHPDQFLERPTTVTVVSSGTNTIFDNALKVAGMFFLRGDDNPRSNLPGRPVLDPFLAIGFIAGLIVCIVRIRRRESRLLLLWLGVMTLPSVLTDFAPHFGRDIGAIPVVPLIVANGFGAIVDKITSRRLLITVYCLLFTGLLFSTYSTINDYFNDWGKRTGLFDSFDVGILSLAQKLHDRPANEALYVSPIDSEYYTMNYGLAGRDVRSFDGRNVLVVPPSGVIADYGIITRDDKQSLNRLSKIFPQGRVVDSISDYIVKSYASIYRTDGTANIAPQKSMNAQLGDAIKLVGYDMTRDNSTIVYTIYWRSIAETKDDYTVFVHLVGATNVVAQDDTRPGRGSYPTFRWRVGETIIDEYRLTIPTDAPRGEYQIEVGMYNLETGVRVRMIDATGAPMENDRVIFERSTLP